MRAGIVILPDERWSVAARRWRLAEEYGFAHAWTYDHLGWRSLVDGPWFDAVPTLTAAAQVTSRIRLGTLVASPNFRHPVPFARQVTAMDDISGGRILLGIGSGAGGTSFDATVLGQPALTPKAQAERYAEFLELLDQLLRSGDPAAPPTRRDRVTWHGKYFAAVDARSIPGCVQSPRVPFVVAANGPRSRRLAARFGQGWVTTGGPAENLDGWWRVVADSAQQFTEAMHAAGRDPSSVDRYLSLDASPVYSLSSVGAFTDAVGRAAELDFTDVVTHWPRRDDWYAGDEAVLEAVATEVLPTL